jgi:rod shape-determining protein MreD
MRWLTFSLLVIIVLTFQSAVGPRLALLGSRPDWLLVVVVFLALYAPAQDAVLGAGLIGLGGDLLSIERLGLLVLSYVLAAMVIVGVREHVFKSAHTTRFILTLVVGLALRLGWTAYYRALYDSSVSVGLELLNQVVVGAVYTACWAIPLHFLLVRCSQLFGFARPRYSYAGVYRGEGGRV